MGKYFQSWLHPDRSDSATPFNGSVKIRYLNGLNVEDGTNYVDPLDGFLVSVTSLDSSGTVLAETT